MLKKLNQLEKQHGGAIPFSALQNKRTTKKSRKKSIKKSRKKSNKKIQKKRTISPARARRKITKKTKRSKKKTIREKKEKNCSCGSHKYTGKEGTPRGLGKCEECIPLNVVMKGKDNKLYENRNEGWIQIN